MDEEHAAAAVIGLYRRHAATWAADRGEALPEAAWLDRFRALLPPRAAILDLGCGAGVPIARALIEAGHAVTGVDAAPEMIALCRARFPAGDWRVADMRGLDLGRAFDGVIAWDSVFHLPQEDQRGMFAVFRRHAAPGAALMYTSAPAGGRGDGQLPRRGAVPRQPRCGGIPRAAGGKRLRRGGAPRRGSGLRLAGSGEKVVAVALDVGYESEAAFKRLVGVPLATWRRGRGAPGAG